MKKRKHKKRIAEAILMIALAIFVITIIFNTDDNPEEILSAIKNANYFYVGIAVLVLILYMFLYYISLQILCYFTNIKSKPKDIFLISSTEFFMNGVTPGAIGGQPFQVYAFKQVNVDASKSTGIILMNFVCGQIAQILLCFIFLYNFKYMQEYASGMIWIFFVGLIVNIIGVLFFFSICFSKKFRMLMVRIVAWFSRRKIFKRFTNMNKDFEDYITKAQDAFASCLKYKRIFFLSVFSKMIAYAVYYIIPFFILKALSVDITYTDIFLILSLTSFSLITANYLPTPGASGGIEFAFKNFFASILVLSSSVAAAGVLIWRVLTYYLLMLFSFICYAIFTKSKHDKYFNKKDLQVNSEELDIE